MVWSVLGRAVHGLLEEYGRRLHGVYTEERAFAEIDGWRISGGMDLQMEEASSQSRPRRVIVDWKTTTAKAAANGKIEWERQLNLYALLYRRKHGIPPDELRVCAIIRDWQKEKALAQASYPQAPIVNVPIALWEPERQEDYVRQRIALHAAARAAETFGDEPLECTDEERWKRPGSWALIKVGNKRATAVYEDEIEARKALDVARGEAKKGVEFILDHRPGLPYRCVHYCDVAQFCSQWKREQAGLNLKEIQDED
jgi:hypothetical protein